MFQHVPSLEMWFSAHRHTFPWECIVLGSFSCHIFFLFISLCTKHEHDTALKKEIFILHQLILSDQLFERQG